MADFVAIKATIYPQTHKSRNVTWKAKFGKRFDGKDLLKNFKTEAEAKHFQNEWNLKLVQGKTSGLADLDNITKHEVLAAMEKLKAFNATLPEAVEFFLRYARPEKGQITIKEAVTFFLESKEQAGRSETYIRNCKKTFYRPFQRAFPEEKIVSEVTPSEAEKYIHSHKDWEDTSRASHISYLRTFYNFLIRKNYAKLNPFKDIDKPVAQTLRAKTISPEATQKLMQYALDTNRKAECACMALVFFCGVRVHEVGRLTWNGVDLNAKEVTVEWEEAKKRKRRVNKISDNAMEWLKLCQSTGDIAPNDYLQRMKRVRQRAAVKYPQNAMRHCFSAYHIAKCGEAAQTAKMLGHPNALLLYQTYYSVVKPKDVEPYWNIIPDSVKTQREQDARLKAEQADTNAKEQAEEASNCGEAIRDEDGNWTPVMNE
jgi:integrase